MDASDSRLTDDFDPLAAEDLHSAHDLYRDMRGRCPVAHSNAWNGFWALLRYDDVVAPCASRTPSSLRFKTWSRRLRSPAGGLRCISIRPTTHRTAAR